MKLLVALCLLTLTEARPGGLRIFGDQGPRSRSGGIGGALGVRLRVPPDTTDRGNRGGTGVSTGTNPDQGGSQGAGSSCPEVADGFTCFSGHYEPVTCADGCVYVNSCYATGAQGDAAACVPTPPPENCAEPNDPTVSCVVESNQHVVCGGLGGCVYQSLCYAIAAGVMDAESNCERVQILGGTMDEDGTGGELVLGTPINPYIELDGCPPSINAEITCALEEDDPVVCDTCPYRSACHARTTGAFNPTTDCKPFDLTETIAEPVCPFPEPEPCTLLWDPVICGDDDCLYANECVANATKIFDPAVDCSPAPSDPYEAEPYIAIDPPFLGTCPVGVGNCPRNYAPVTCGPGCTYGNECIADSTGEYNVAQDCEPLFLEELNCPVPDLSATTCLRPDPADAIICNGDCYYDSLCLMGGVFREADCVPAVIEPTNADSAVCPDSNGVCNRIYLPVICGMEGCIYNNECLAASTGEYNIAQDCVLFLEQREPVEYEDISNNNYEVETECRPLNPNIRCASGPPVVCDLSCSYNNECEARGAGYNIDEECFFGAISDPLPLAP